jgi:dihydroorotate dehydrogenase (fumarate)
MYTELKVVFANDTLSSLNSYGYSPYPLATYLSWVQGIIESDPMSSKPFIISITSSSPENLGSMIDNIQTLRTRLGDRGDISRIAIELNTSCPNIKESTPPAYSFPSLTPLLNVLSEHFWNDETLTLGLKLAPFVHAAQFSDVIRGISSFSKPDVYGKNRNPFAFLTSTNTLGSCLLFSDQITKPVSKETLFAVPPVLGGLAGESIHALSLGNVYKFAQLLSSSSDDAVRSISIIGVGGVTSKEAVMRMKSAGATAVGCATYLGREGVSAFAQLS